MIRRLICRAIGHRPVRDLRYRKVCRRCEEQIGRRVPWKELAAIDDGWHPRRHG